MAALLAALLAGGAPCLAAQVNGTGQGGSFIRQAVAEIASLVCDAAQPAPPSWVAWSATSLTCDLDLDGTAENVVLEDRRVQVSDATSGQGLCTSDDAWQVSDCLVGDVDGDGRPELVLVVWKRGSFGPARPFWLSGPDIAWSQHVFIMRYGDGALHGRWMSSALEFELAGASLTQDGELVTTTRAGGRLVWAWEGFGLKLQEEPSA